MTYTVNDPIVAASRITAKQVLDLAIPSLATNDSVNLGLADAESLPNRSLRHCPGQRPDGNDIDWRQFCRLFVSRVVFHGTRLHVIGVDTPAIRAVGAAMIRNRVSGKLPESHFVVMPVRAPRASLARDTPVSIAVFRQQPVPASSYWVNHIFNARLWPSLLSRRLERLGLALLHNRLTLATLAVPACRSVLQRERQARQLTATTLAFARLLHAFNSSCAQLYHGGHQS